MRYDEASQNVFGKAGLAGEETQVVMLLAFLQLLKLQVAQQWLECTFNSFKKGWLLDPVCGNRQIDLGTQWRIKRTGEVTSADPSGARTVTMTSAPRASCLFD